MKQFLIVSVITASLSLPASAEDVKPAPEPLVEGGFSLMEEGARIFLRGLLREVEPAMEDLKALTDQLEPNLEKLLTEMAPALNNLADMMDDVTAYELPERLPNGDIIIRRKADAPPLADPAEEIDI